MIEDEATIGNYGIVNHSYLPTTPADRIEIMSGDSTELTTEQKIDEIHQNMRQILAFVENINNQVQPFMDKLKSSPLGTMFGA